MGGLARRLLHGTRPPARHPRQQERVRSVCGDEGRQTRRPRADCQLHRTVAVMVTSAHLAKSRPRPQRSLSAARMVASMMRNQRRPVLAALAVALAVAGAATAAVVGSGN